MFMRLTLLRCFTLDLLNFHPSPQREFVQGFFEVDAFALHHELEDIPTFIACPKTTPGSRFRPDHESRRVLVIVERTKTGHISTGFTQFHPRLRNQVNDVYFGFDLINGGHAREL